MTGIQIYCYIIVDTCENNCCYRPTTFAMIVNNDWHSAIQWMPVRTMLHAVIIIDKSFICLQKLVERVKIHTATIQDYLMQDDRATFNKVGMKQDA